jgi:hypothetical protein
MQTARRAFETIRIRTLRFSAPLIPLLLACSSTEPGPAASGGSPGSTGGTTVTSGGSTGGSTGGAPSTGGTIPTTGGISTGGISTGGISTGGISTGGISTGGISTGGISTGGISTGGISTGGTSSGGTTTGGTSSGGTTTGGVSSGGSSSGGSSNAGASTGGSGGAGGGQQPGAALNGASWTMKCTAPHSGNLCYLLPAGQSACPSAGYTSLDQTLQFGGTPGTTYQVTLHLEGTHEAGDYSGGTAITKEFLKGATHANNGVHTWLSMEVSAPAATYNPNAGAGAGSVQIYDYRVTIPIEGGATVRMKAFDKDCDMHRYCQNNNTNPCKGYVLDGISPASNPIDGSFLRMTVESVKAM